MSKHTKSLSIVIFFLTLAFGGLSPFPSQAITKASPTPNLEQRIEDKREKVREELQEKREEISKRIDQNRGEVAARIVGKISDLNDRMSDVYTRHLDRLNAILNKIQNRANRLKQDGASIDSVTAAIQAARSKITEAQTAVNVQRATTYSVPQATEGEMGMKLGELWQKFVDDQKKVRNLIKDARDAVQDAFAALHTVRTSPIPSITP